MTTTTNVDLSLDLDSDVMFWQNSKTAIKIVTVVVSILGLLGNLLSYKTADFMPKSNSSVLMKYLAVWDFVAVVNLGLIPSLDQLVGTNITGTKVSNQSRSKRAKNFLSLTTKYTLVQKRPRQHF